MNSFKNRIYNLVFGGLVLLLSVTLWDVIAFLDGLDSF